MRGGESDESGESGEAGGSFKIFIFFEPCGDEPRGEDVEHEEDEGWRFSRRPIRNFWKTERPKVT